MKKIFTGLLIILILACFAVTWMFFGSATAFKEKSRFLYIYENENIQKQVETQLQHGPLLRHLWLFDLLAGPLDLWNNLKPGKFEIQKGQSLYSVIRKLRNNHQSPVRLVINKLRTTEDLARIIGKNFSSDSADAMQFFSNADSLNQLGVDSNTLMTLVIPDTYILNWNTPVRRIMKRLEDEKEKFWEKKDRLQKAEALGLTPQQVYILASIIEEETNNNEEKGNMASVYLNRLRQGMALGADPTIKFALKNFAIKRILLPQLSVESPYNTYRNKGLPPGSICTPSPITIDAVLNAPNTNYLFFVAKSDFSGTHQFTSSYAEHQRYAKEYQQALNERKINK